MCHTPRLIFEPSYVETQEIGVLNLNEEYTYRGHDVDFRVSGDASDGEDNTDYHPNNHQPPI